jgi:uncharacterized oligopeptide transporter (OPT) family protein
VLSIGGVVCIASSNAGDTSQDLKTGYLLGATPKWQQASLLIGVTVSTFAVGYTLTGMNRGLEEFRAQSQQIDINNLPSGVAVQETNGRQTFDRPRFTYKTADGQSVSASGSDYVLLNAINSPTVANGKYLYNPKTRQIEVQWIQGIGSERAAAPQAQLMSTVINGILSRKLPWGLVMLGVFLVITVELLGIRSLAFAVGAYLSIGTTLAIFVGGVVRWLVDTRARRGGQVVEEGEVSSGSLFASGLIAAGGIVGLLGIALKLVESTGAIPENSLLWSRTNPLNHGWISVVMYALLAFSLYYFASKRVETHVAVTEKI